MGGLISSGIVVKINSRKLQLIREKGFNQELVDNYITYKRFIRELVERDKEYD